MKQIVLQQSPVQFIENREEGLHKYLMGLTELTGVTTILREVIFRDKYEGIDPEVLRNAATRGTAIHEAVQAWMMREKWTPAEDLMPYYEEAVEALEAWKADGPRAAMEALATEYTISDCKEVATRADVVTEAGENLVDLDDIKTTYALDEEFLSWQLSVEKYYFEKQNPGVKVRKLLAFWYNRQRKVWAIKEVPYKGDVEVERLMAAWRAGEFWGLPAPAEGDVPAVVSSIAEVYAELEAEAQRATAKRDEFRARLMQAMKDNGVKSIKAEGFQVTYVEAGTTSKFDKAGLVAAHPDWQAEINKFTKSGPRAESIKITLK